MRRAFRSYTLISFLGDHALDFTELQDKGLGTALASHALRGHRELSDCTCSLWQCGWRSRRLRPRPETPAFSRGRIWGSSRDSFKDEHKGAQKGRGRGSTGRLWGRGDGGPRVSTSPRTWLIRPQPNRPLHMVGGRQEEQGEAAGNGHRAARTVHTAVRVPENTYKRPWWMTRNEKP